jgi:DNA-binding response OmpR family regulator
MNSRADRLNVLVVEDEMLVAMMLEAILEEAGYRAFMAARLAKGLEIATNELIHAAILDINLAGQTSFPIADVLKGRGIPFVFASGYGSSGVPEAYHYAPVLQKPYDVAEIEAAIASLLKRER